MSKQVVLFDVDGVLIQGYHATRTDLRHCWDEDIETDLKINRERFKREFIFGPFVKDVIVGKKDFKDVLTEYLPTFGFHDDAQIVVDYWLDKDSVTNQDVLETIKIMQASGQFKLYIATNQEHYRAKYLMNQLGFKEYFDDIFYSAKIGFAKPSVDYFQSIAKALNLPSDEKPILFDDTPNVVEAARAFGWEAHEFATVDDLGKSPFIKQFLTSKQVI